MTDLEAAHAHLVGRTIYVVDDNADLRVVTALLLRMLGIRVVTFPSAMSCLATLATHADDPPAALLLDLEMPVMDGPSLIAAMTAAGHRVPVVILTGAPDSTLAVQARAAGVRHILTKPCEPAALLAALADATRDPPPANVAQKQG